jgi:hypothetical protein
MKIWDLILNTSEAWALLIPLMYIILKKPLSPLLKPIIFYVVLAFLFNTMATIIWVFNKDMPQWLNNNNVFYNLHSIARVVFFSWYLLKIADPGLKKLTRVVLGLYIAGILINFLFNESVFFLSIRLFIAQSVILLSLYIIYLLRSLRDDSKTNFTKEASFLVCTGILIYEASTFFIWLFIMELAVTDPQFGLFCLDLYKIVFVIFCIILTAAFHRTEKTSGALRRT